VDSAHLADDGPGAGGVVVLWSRYGKDRRLARYPGRLAACDLLTGVGRIEQQQLSEACGAAVLHCLSGVCRARLGAAVRRL